MSTDEPDWFSSRATSSNPAHDDGPEDRSPRLSPVTPREPNDSETAAGEWFGSTAEESAPADAGADSPRFSSAPSSPKHAKALFAGTVVLLLGILGAGAVAVANIGDSGGDSSGPPSPMALPPTPSTVTSSSATASPSKPSAAPVAGAECKESQTPTVTTGAGKGDTASVAGAVLAFDHAYYVERDAQKIKPLLAKDSELRNLDAIQKGIDSVPKGTKHCLRIVADGPDAATVELTETAPNGASTVFKQRFVTARQGGEVRIVTVNDIT